MKILKTNNMKNYKELLKNVILDNINNKITIILSFNYLNQYMFEKKDIDIVQDNLFFSRIEQPYDLLAILKSIQFDEYFRSSKTLIITPFEHLLDDNISYLKDKIMKILIRIEERYKKDIILMDFNKKWDTQYHLNEILSTQN